MEAGARLLFLSHSQVIVGNVGQTDYISVQPDVHRLAEKTRGQAEEETQRHSQQIWYQNLRAKAAICECIADAAYQSADRGRERATEQKDIKSLNGRRVDREARVCVCVCVSLNCIVHFQLRRDKNPSARPASLNANFFII